MKADKPTIAHCIRVMLKSAADMYGDDFRVILGPKHVQIEVQDLVGHDLKVETVEQLVNHLVPNASSEVRKQERAEDIAKILAEYPRRRDLGAARSAVSAALADGEIPVPVAERAEYLRVATRLFARWCAVNKKEQEWIPYPQTWFRRKSYLNATKVVLSLMEQLKKGVQQPVLKRGEMPITWGV